LWNPSRFADKALHDMVNSLLDACTFLKESSTAKAIQVTQPYLALLAWTMEWDASVTLGNRRQFAIVSSAGDRGRTAEVVFVSDFHSLT
jgi:acetone carboxylase gamma subunit